MKLLNTLLAAGAFAIASTSAHALALDYDDWDTDGTCAVGDLDPAAADCFGLISATNDNNNGSQEIGKVDVNFDKFDGTLGLFGYQDWDFLTKYEGTNYVVDGNTVVFRTSENDLDVDLNGDGDEFDTVLHSAIIP